MTELFFKGFLIATIFGVPAGAVGVLTIQRTLERGFISGFLTGLGSSVADVLYACVGAFGITLISDFLTAYQFWISLCGGILIAVYGVIIFCKKSQVQKGVSPKPVKCFLTSLSIAILNPATIVSFMLVFSTFGIDGKFGTGGGISLVLGILAGTVLWWTAISAVVALFRKHITNKIYLWMNRILGTLLGIFGAVMFLRGLKSIF